MRAFPGREGTISPVTHVARLEELLEGYAPILGKDFASYRSHTYRVVNFCSPFLGDEPGSLEKVAIAAAFHDLGIWTESTLDYLSPSERLAQEYLTERGKGDWADEIGAMIREHHKITPYRREPSRLVEAFRKVDWIDISRGIVAFGLPRKFLREVFTTFPDAGFHRLLLQLSFKRFVTHPWSPLPILRL